MVGICPLYSMILQEMHFKGDCCFRICITVKGHELFNSLFSWNKAHSEPHDIMYMNLPGPVHVLVPHQYSSDHKYHDICYIRRM